MVIYHSYVSLPEGNPYEYESQLSKYFAQIIDCLWLSRLLSDFLDNHETTEIKSSIKNDCHVIYTNDITEDSPGYPTPPEPPSPNAFPWSKTGYGAWHWRYLAE